MSSVKKLLGYVFILIAAAFVTNWAVMNHLRSKQNPQQTGLEWMRTEYDLDERTFAQVERLHQTYFAQCQVMTRKIGSVDRILLVPPRRGELSEDAKRSALQLDNALCMNYEVATLKHLQEVAALMSPAHAERFLNDFTSSVQRQRMEHQRALSEKVN